LVNTFQNGSDLSTDDVKSIVSNIASGLIRESKEAKGKVFSSPFYQGAGKMKFTAGDEKKAGALHKKFAEQLKAHEIDSASI